MLVVVGVVGDAGIAGRGHQLPGRRVDGRLLQGRAAGIAERVVRPLEQAAGVEGAGVGRRGRRAARDRIDAHDGGDRLAVQLAHAARARGQLAAVRRGGGDGIAVLQAIGGEHGDAVDRFLRGAGVERAAGLGGDRVLEAQAVMQRIGAVGIARTVGRARVGGDRRAGAAGGRLAAGQGAGGNGRQLLAVGEIVAARGGAVEPHQPGLRDVVVNDLLRVAARAADELRAELLVQLVVVV